jgi:hypothetical protein
MRHLLTSILMVFASAGPSLAEPSPSISKLMSEPVSLLTFGQVRMEMMVDARLEKFSFTPPLFGKPSYSRLVAYNWDRNEINVVLFGTETMPTGWNYEEECRQTIDMLRQLAWVDRTTGKATASNGVSLFASQFGQIGYTNETLENLQRELDKTFSLQVTTAGGLTCYAPLLGTGYSVGR